jgi:hypothetical protein
MIAAIALVNGLTVVTRTVADFAAFGAGFLNPFEFRTKPEMRANVAHHPPQIASGPPR